MLENLSTCARHDPFIGEQTEEHDKKKKTKEVHAPINSGVGLSGPYIVKVFPEPVCPYAKMVPL